MPVTMVLCPVSFLIRVPELKKRPAFAGTVSQMQMAESSLPENRKLDSSARHVTGSACPRCSPVGS